MNDSKQDLDALARRASDGDSLAMEALQQAIEQSLGPIARRALRLSGNAAGLTRHMRKLVHGVLDDVDPHGLTDALARSICEGLCRSPRGPGREHLARETVRNW